MDLHLHRVHFLVLLDMGLYRIDEGNMDNQYFRHVNKLDIAIHLGVFVCSGASGLVRVLSGEMSSLFGRSFRRRIRSKFL